jgi:serine-type D-Ala-D-Ala carboxypeptidase (penicillin-binding protein 5/6)
VIERGRLIESRRMMERRRRQRRRRARGALLALVVLVVAIVGVVWLMAASASSPRISRAQVRPVPARHQGARPPQTYGWQPAPRSQQVSVKLKLALRAGLLFDIRTGRILWGRDPARELPIASLTKMMTALVVVAHSRPSAPVLVTRQATHFSGSGVGMLPQGKRVPLLALLYGLMLPSGNDAAIALAQHVAGTRAAFIGMMNAKAGALGLRCTHFSTVSGIVDHGNYSCASDLAAIAHDVLEQPLLARIVASRSAILPFPIKGGKLYLYNNNPLLVQGYPGTDGVKTGFTDAAGVCLVASARRGRAWLGVVLLHSADDADQAQTLLTAGFAKLARR